MEIVRNGVWSATITDMVRRFINICIFFPFFKNNWIPCVCVCVCVMCYLIIAAYTISVSFRTYVNCVLDKSAFVLEFGSSSDRSLASWSNFSNPRFRSSKLPNLNPSVLTVGKSHACRRRFLESFIHFF